ncbi:MAG: hypothetical protein ACXVCY_01955 [Pseudobdellovibrionaceae bacterium]
MKNSLMYGLFFFFFQVLAACSQEDANVSVNVTASALPLIPATAVSCLAQKNAGSSVATGDIAASYFKLPVITFTRKDTSKILVVSLVSITINTPGSTTPISCKFGGDTLAALSSTWWSSSTKEASVPAGQATFATDCPLYCGGINTGNTPYTSTGLMEIFGLERNPTTLEEVPVKIQTVISVQNY